MLAVTGVGAVLVHGVGEAALAASLAVPAPAATLPLAPEQLVDPNRLRRLDRLSVLALMAALLAARDARLDTDRSRPRSDVGVVFGTAFGCQATELRYAERLVRQGAYFTNALDFPDSIDGAPAAHVAMELGLRGPSATRADGRLAGELALLHAALALGAGRASAFLVGAGDTVTRLLGAACPGAEGRPDRRPEGAPRGQERRPLDDARRPLAPGEGVGFLVVEPLAAALSRHAPVRALVAGFGSGTDPSVRPDRCAADPAAGIASLRRALAQAEVEPGEISLCSLGAHGDPGLDALEAAAFAAVLRERGEPAPGFAHAAATGPIGAAGILRLAAATVALGRKSWPATVRGVTLERGHPVVLAPCAAALDVRTVLHHASARSGASMSLVVTAP